MKNKKSLKIVLSVICSVFAIAFIVIATLYIINSKSDDSTDNYDITVIDERNNIYKNGDYTFRPGGEQIKYDETEKTIYYNNLLIVYTFSAPDESQVKQLTDSVDGELVGKISGLINAIQIKVKESSLADLNQMAETLMSNENVMYAGFEYPIELSESSLSNDPWSNDSENPDTDIGNESNPSGNDWWAEAIGAYTAWNNIENPQPIKIGVLDSGFDVNHVELVDKISFPENYTTNTMDDHGTHVAGIIAAETNNDEGLRGIVDNAELICVDWFLNENDNLLSSGEYLEITKTLIESGAKVINNSWGQKVLSKDGFTQELYKESNSDIEYLLQYFAVHVTGVYDAYLEYINAMANRFGAACILMISQLLYNGKDDFIIVQSAGNGYYGSNKGFDAKLNGHYCAVTNDIYNRFNEDTREILFQRQITFDTIKDHIVIVGAVENQRVGNNYKLTSFSNFGSTVDICAPGKDIFSTLTDNKYGNKDGTSMAAPIVSGCAALVWANNPSMSASEVKKLLISSTDIKAIGVGDDEGSKYPMLNIGNAILNQTPKNQFLTYLKENENLIDISKFTSLFDISESGVISATIEDFDKNGTEEMVTFSIDVDKQQYSDEYNLFANLYYIEDGKITKKQGPEVSSIAFAGLGSCCICTVIDNGILRVYRNAYSFGGSSRGLDFLSLVVKDNTLTISENYWLYEFYRYDSFKYKEEVSGEEYSDEGLFKNAVENSGFVYAHSMYRSNTESREIAEMKDNHVFALYHGKEEWNNPNAFGGFTGKYSQLSEILP